MILYRICKIYNLALSKIFDGEATICQKKSKPIIFKHNDNCTAFFNEYNKNYIIVLVPDDQVSNGGSVAFYQENYKPLLEQDNNSVHFVCFRLCTTRKTNYI